MAVSPFLSILRAALRGDRSASLNTVEQVYESARRAAARRFCARASLAVALLLDPVAAELDGYIPRFPRARSAICICAALPISPHQSQAPPATSASRAGEPWPAARAALERRCRGTLLIRRKSTDRVLRTRPSRSLARSRTAQDERRRAGTASITSRKRVRASAAPRTSVETDDSLTAGRGETA